jgi:hypothetical protein
MKELNCFLSAGNPKHGRHFKENGYHGWSRGPAVQPWPKERKMQELILRC